MAGDANVVILPGVERRDLMGEPVPSVTVLSAAIDNGITDVVVVGGGRDGQLYLAAESSDADRVVGRLMLAARMLVSREVKHT